MEKRYTCEEVAEYYHVKVTTVYDWIKRGILPAMKIGKRYIITPEQIEQFENTARKNVPPVLRDWMKQNRDSA